MGETHKRRYTYTKRRYNMITAKKSLQKMIRRKGKGKE